METIIVTVYVYNHSTRKEYNYSYRVQSWLPRPYDDAIDIDTAFNLVRIVRKQLRKVYPHMDIEVVGGGKYANQVKLGGAS